MTQLSKNVLQKAVTELNDFLDIKPRIKTTLAESKLAASILQAADLLIVNDEENEFKQLSKSTQKVITVLREEAEEPDADEPEMDEDGFVIEPLLKSEKPAPEEEEEEEEEDVPAPKKPAAKPKVSAEQQVLADMDLADLKSHIKVNKEHFPNACKGVNFAKDKDALLVKALADLGVNAKEQPEPKKEKPAAKKQSTGKEKKVSNKSIAWGVFVSEKITKKEQITDMLVENASSKVPDVQKTTVKGWMRAWVDGKNLPACAKK